MFSPSIPVSLIAAPGTPECSTLTRIFTNVTTLAFIITCVVTVEQRLVSILFHTGWEIYGDPDWD